MVCWLASTHNSNSLFLNLGTNDGRPRGAVYYVADGGHLWQHGDRSAADERAEGCLLLVPKHSAKATQWALTDSERSRLTTVPGLCPGSGDDVCTYAVVPPAPGTIVVFPGWLLHAVMPAAGAPNGQTAARDAEADVLPRISVALNF